jgi:site-specific recombinase XerC
MAEDLAHVLSEIDDVDTIKRVLDIDGSTVSSSNSSDSLGQKTLSELFDRYYDRKENRSPTTRSQYKRTIPVFVEFAEEHGITTPNQISTELVDRFVDELKDEHDADATVLTYTKNVRAWLRWLQKRQLCSEPVFRILDKDELGLSPTARDEAIPKQIVAQILRNLRQKRRGSHLHAITELFWNAGPRIGGVHSSDLRDFDIVNNEIRFRHRPSTGTRLKNGDKQDDQPGDGERNIELESSVIEAIKLYIETERPDVTDEYGRQPLFTTTQGRASKSTLRRWIYEATSCRWIPEELENCSCDGSCDPDTDVCPYSYYPHAIRRGSIVNHLSNGLRPDYASGRFDVSTKVIKDHYDPRTKQRRKEDRVEHVRDAWSTV